MIADTHGPVDPFAMWHTPSVSAIPLNGDAAATLMGRTVGEGATWPDEDAVRAARVPVVLVERQISEALEWIRRVIREDWLPNDLPDRLVAARGVLDGTDAVLAAWTIADRPLRVAVTRERLHLLSSLSSPPREDTRWLSDQALAVANDLLRLDDPLSGDEFEERRFGGAMLMTMAPNDLADWDQTLLLLARDRTVKITALRRLGRTSPPKGVSPFAEEPPWFPHP